MASQLPPMSRQMFQPGLAPSSLPSLPSLPTPTSCSCRARHNRSNATFSSLISIPTQIRLLQILSLVVIISSHMAVSSSRNNDVSHMHTESLTTSKQHNIILSTRMMSLAKTNLLESDDTKREKISTLKLRALSNSHDGDKQAIEADASERGFHEMLPKEHSQQHLRPIDRNVEGEDDEKNEVDNSNEVDLDQNRSNDDSSSKQTENKRPDQTPSQQKAKRRLQTFFDNLLQMQHQYGSNVITIQDASELHPVLRVSSTSFEDCPFSYIPWQGHTNSSGHASSNSKTCFTPVITIFDLISNSWPSSTPPPPPSFETMPPPITNIFNTQIPTLLLISGIDNSIEEMDILAPSSIVETIRLLLDCAVCEALSPWVNVNKNANNATDSGDVSTDDGSGKGTESNSKEDNDGKSTSSHPPSNTPPQTLNAIQCRKDLQSQGINDELRRWMARLVATRKIVAVPMADVKGFYERLVVLEEEREHARDKERDLAAATVEGNFVGKVINITQRKETSHENEHHYGSECDFPFPSQWKSSSSKSSSDNGESTCMNTFPARLANELFRSHSFQLGLSFHGSDSAPVPLGSGQSGVGQIGIPQWNNGGDKDQNYGPPAVVSFDEEAMLEISWAFSAFGGMFDISKNREEGDIVAPYTVVPNDANGEICHGATMEQWAFSARIQDGSYELRLQPCQCDSNVAASQPGGLDNQNDKTCAYPPERTGVYDGSSLRSFIASVKAPPSNQPSSHTCIPGFDSVHKSSPDDDSPCPPNPDLHFLYDATPFGNNIRMSLLATELIEPWTSVRSIAGVELREEDIIPLSPRLPGACQLTRVMTLPSSPLMKNITITWTVGGALTVDETAIMHGKWDVLDKKIFDCVTKPTKDEIDSFFAILRDFEVMEGESTEEMMEEASFTPVQSGFTRWHSSQSGKNEKSTVSPPETTFSVTVDLSQYKVGDVIALYALARVDQNWVHGHFGSENGIIGATPPQTNLVNARTNPDWLRIHHGGDSSVIKGRLDFFSVPVTIEIGPAPGFFEGKKPIETSVRPSDEAFVIEEQGLGGMVAYSLFMAVVVVAVVFFCVFCREESDGTDVFSVLSEHRKISRQKISMDDFFTDEAENGVQLELT